MDEKLLIGIQIFQYFGVIYDNDHVQYNLMNRFLICDSGLVVVGMCSIEQRSTYRIQTQIETASVIRHVSHTNNNKQQQTITAVAILPYLMSINTK